MARDEAIRDTTPADGPRTGQAVATDPPPSGEPGSTAELLATLDQALTALRAQPLSDAVGDAALTDSVEQLERLERRLHAEKVRRVGEVEDRQAFAGQARSTADLLADRLNLTRGEARAHTDAAEALHALPQTADLFARGELGIGQVRQAARGMSELSRHADGDAATALHGLDELVATQGREQDRGQLRQTIDAYIDETAPDALSDREQRAWQRRRLKWHTGRDGLLHLDGRLDPVSGAHVTAALEPLARPDGADDPRLAEQRRADALTSLARRHLDTGELPQVARQRPHVMLITHLDALRDQSHTADTTSPGAEAAGATDADAAGPSDPETADADDVVAGNGEGSAAPRGDGAATRPLSLLDGVGPVSSSTARQLACDAEVTEVVVGRNDEVLDVGRAHAEPTTRQWSALAARDRGCIGCGAPISRCQAHHIVFWSHCGRTDLENLCLLCWGCHHRVHHHGWAVVRAASGTFVLRPPAPPVPEDDAPAHHRRPD